MQILSIFLKLQADFVDFEVDFVLQAIKQSGPAFWHTLYDSASCL